MSLTPGQRITMINECATLLDKREWAEIDLIIEQHGLPTTDMWNGDDKRSYVIAMTKDASNPALELLHQYLTGESDHSAPGRSPFSGGKVRLFMSHLAVHRAVVGEVARRLDQYGVEAFVAHDSIEPSLEWQQVIEAALMDCDAMAVFLHSGFKESNWCDQEVGWAMGRNRPLLPLHFDTHPYGFMGKFQSQKCLGLGGFQVGDAITEWLVRVPTLRAAMAESLSHAFLGSGSWNFTRKLVPLLEQIPSFTEDQLARMERAAEENVNVRECGIGETDGPIWVQNFAGSRREDEPAASWAAEGPPY